MKKKLFLFLPSGGICMSLATLPLPETLGEPLPQCLADMKKMKEKTKREGCRLLKRRGEKGAEGGGGGGVEEQGGSGGEGGEGGGGREGGGAIKI